MSHLPPNPVKKVIETIRLVQAEYACSLSIAAFLTKKRLPAECLATMERIGSWPASEPELRALQSVS